MEKIITTFGVTKESTSPILDMFPGGRYYRNNMLHIKYEDWLKINGAEILDFSFHRSVFSISFKNSEDAILFKLRYM